MVASLQQRKVPCVVTFLNPFRIVLNEEHPAWECSIEQINSSAWDYVDLHKTVGAIDVGFQPPYHMLVGRDGALALPPIPEIHGNQTTAEFFNKCLSAILIGGVYCEAIDPDKIEQGLIIDWKYIKANGMSTAQPNRLHSLLRGQSASAIEAIVLESPKQIEFSSLLKAYEDGNKVLSLVPKLSGEFLIRGVTAYTKQNWSSALANLWIVVEQLTNTLWENRVVELAKGDGISGRKDSLKDFRTWTISHKHELLYQLKVIDKDTFSNLGVARRARNKLSHDGKHVEKESAYSALESIKSFLFIIVGALAATFLSYEFEKGTLIGPYDKLPSKIVNPKYWMPIKKLPGEEDLEKLAAKVRKASKSVASPNESGV
jgi:hypothetical protein